MRKPPAPKNPLSSKLAEGLSVEDIVKAVESSGYPLQILVAESFDDSFQIKQEWAYVDRETEEPRTLDLLACRDMYDKESHEAHLYPVLKMLIECKHSEHPYIFFLSNSRFVPPELPLVTGLNHSSIELAASKDSCKWDTPFCVALSAYSHPFTVHPDYCFTFSKIRRQGKRLELSGSEAYNSIVLPLTKALTHLHDSEKPKDTFVYFDFGMAIAIAVIDGPMIGIRDNEARFVPWVRVLRYEHQISAAGLPIDNLYPIDFVHAGFFGEYRDRHLLPFMTEFAERALRHEVELTSGEATLSDFNTPTQEMEAYLQPRSADWHIEQNQATEV